MYDVNYDRGAKGWSFPSLINLALQVFITCQLREEKNILDFSQRAVINFAIALNISGIYFTRILCFVLWDFVGKNSSKR